MRLVQPMNLHPTAPVGFVGGHASATRFERAARDLGIELIVFTPDWPEPLDEIGAMATRSTAATFDDLVTRSAVITVDHGCDHQTYRDLMDAAGRKLRPSSSTIHLAHDPLAARYVFQDCGFSVAEFEEIDSGDDDAVERFGRRHGWPVRLIAPRWGPAEAAVHVVRPSSVLDQAWADSSGQLWLLEACEPAAPQLTVVIARRPSGEQIVNPVTVRPDQGGRPQHLQPVAAPIVECAIATAVSIADGLDATGVVTVKFVYGNDGRLLVDDFAIGPDVDPLLGVALDDSLVAVHLRAILDWRLHPAPYPTRLRAIAAPRFQSMKQQVMTQTTSISEPDGITPTTAGNGATATVDSFEQPVPDFEIAHVGIVGGGQLARMMVLAAARLGIEVSVLARPTDEAIRSIVPHVVLGDPADPRVLDDFTRRCQVVTFDHENVDPDVIDALTRLGRVIRPGAAALRACDKGSQRIQLAALGFPVPPFTVAPSADQMTNFARSNGGWPVVAKSRRGGYDGRGVRFVDGEEQAIVACTVAADGGLLIEPALAIERELAVLVARRPGGKHVVYPVVEAHTRNFVCDSLVVPAQIDPAIASEAAKIAIEIADVLDVVGILAVEFFIVDGNLIVNEIAPRPHNTGHFTIEGCVTSQFENHLRAVLDIPLGSTDLVAPAVATANVLGGSDGVDPRTRTASALVFDRAHVHLYAKQARTGRKLGHVTVLDADPRIALATARQARDAFNGERA